VTSTSAANTGQMLRVDQSHLTSRSRLSFKNLINPQLQPEAQTVT